MGGSEQRRGTFPPGRGGGPGHDSPVARSDSDGGGGRDSRSRGCSLGGRWKLLLWVIGAAAPSLLLAGYLSRTLDEFAWVLFGFACALFLLICSQVARWRRDQRLGNPGLQFALVLCLCLETALDAALAVLAVLERSVPVLVAGAVVLLLGTVACDIAVARRIRRAERPRRQAREPTRDTHGGAASSGRWLWDWTTILDESGGFLPVAPPDKGSEDATGTRRPARGALGVLVSLAVAYSQSVGPVAAAGAICVLIAAGTGHFAHRHHHGGNGGASASAGSESTETPGTGVGGSSNPGTSSRAGGSGAGLAPVAVWNGPCSAHPSEPRVSPKAVRRMLRLLKHETHLEPSLEGCVGEMTPHDSHRDFYVTAPGVQTQTNAELSYIVYSEHYGGVLVLEDARSELEAVVREAGPVGGVGRFPHYRFSAGDFYLLRSPRGVYVLLRAPGADAYEILRPGLMRAWYLLSFETNHLLSVSPPISLPNGTLIYRMWSPELPKEIEVLFDPRSDTATAGPTAFPAYAKFEPSLNELVELGAYGSASG